MENNKKEKKKINISPEQVESACKKMGDTANAVDNFYNNLKDRLGPVGKAIGFGVVVTLLFSLIKSPGLVWILLLAVAVGAAPIIHKKMKEIQIEAEAKLAERKKEKENNSETKKE